MGGWNWKQIASKLAFDPGGQHPHDEYEWGGLPLSFAVHIEPEWFSRNNNKTAVT